MGVSSMLVDLAQAALSKVPKRPLPTDFDEAEKVLRLCTELPQPGTPGSQDSASPE